MVSSSVSTALLRLKIPDPAKYFFLLILHPPLVPRLVRDVFFGSDFALPCENPNDLLNLCYQDCNCRVIGRNNLGLSHYIDRNLDNDLHFSRGKSGYGWRPDNFLDGKIVPVVCQNLAWTPGKVYLFLDKGNKNRREI